MGPYHSLAISKEGQLYTWGRNYYGELGHGTSGTKNNKNIPTRIGTATNWKSIAAGGEHSLAINEAGELYAWGLNDFGHLGDGSRINKNKPKTIPHKTIPVKIQNPVFE